MPSSASLRFSGVVFLGVAAFSWFQMAAGWSSGHREHVFGVVVSGIPTLLGLLLLIQPWRRRRTKQ